MASIASYNPLNSIGSPGTQRKLTQKEIETLAKTIAGEIDARTSVGGGRAAYGTKANRQEIANVLETMSNRAAASGRTLAEEALRPSQYSTWNTKASRSVANKNYNANRGYIESAVNDYLTGALTPTNEGLTNYYSPSSMLPAGRKPGFAVNLEQQGQAPIQVGPHKFYADPNVARASPLPPMPVGKVTSASLGPPSDYATAFTGNLPRAKPLPPIKDFAAVPSPKRAASASASVSGDPFGYLRDTAIYDSRLWDPSLQKAWGSEARALPNPTIDAQAAPSSIFGRGTIDPSKASARGMSPAPIASGANALKPISVGLGPLQTSAKALPSMPMRAAASAQRPISISGMIGTENSPGKREDDFLGLSVTPRPVPTVSVGPPATNEDRTLAMGRPAVPQPKPPTTVPTIAPPAIPSPVPAAAAPQKGLLPSLWNAIPSMDSVKQQAGNLLKQAIVNQLFSSPLQRAGAPTGGAGFMNALAGMNLGPTDIARASYMNASAGQPQARTVPSMPTPNRADPRNVAAQVAAINAMLSNSGIRGSQASGVNQERRY